MKHIQSIIDKKFFFFLFLISMFLIKFPPFYLFLFPNKIFSSHSLAKAIIILVLFFLIISHRVIEKIENQKLLILIILFYLLIQSVSILKATDTFLFLKDFHNVVVSLLLFITAYVFSGNISFFYKINKFVLITGFIVIIFDLIFLLFPKEFIQISRFILQREIITLYNYNLDRNRYNLYLNTELFLPFYINFFINSQDKIKKALGAVGTILIVFLAFVSNFRHRILFLIVIFMFYCIYFFVNRHTISIKKSFAIIALIIFSFLISFFFVRTYKQYDVINRFLLEEESEDINSISFRIGYLYQSVELIKTSPLIGVGLGNFQLYVSNKQYTIGDKTSKDFYIDSRKETHSIISKTISETGILGLLTFSILNLYFLLNDLLIIRKTKSVKIFAYVTVFWGFFILSLITPSITLFRGGWMWFVRGIITARYHLMDHQRSSS